jgi:hypothetical protein
MESSNNNVYIKRGRKYIPFGSRYDERYLPDGIWFVHHNEYSHGHTNVDHYLEGLFRVGDSPKVIDVPKLCSMKKYVDYVLESKEMRDIMDSGRFSYLELVSKITALVVELNEKVKNGTR